MFVQHCRGSDIGYGGRRTFAQLDPVPPPVLRIVVRRELSPSMGNQFRLCFPQTLTVFCRQFFFVFFPSGLHRPFVIRGSLRRCKNRTSTRPLCQALTSLCHRTIRGILRVRPHLFAPPSVAPFLNSSANRALAFFASLLFHFILVPLLLTSAVRCANPRDS